MSSPLFSRRHWCRSVGLALGAPTALALAGCAAPSSATRPLAADAPILPGLVPPFSGTSPWAALPAGWHPHIMRRDRPPTHYDCVERDGRVVVHALAERSTSGLRCDVNIDPRATPWLHWSWRVDRFPDGVTVADDDRDDSPARVVIAFEGDLARLSLRDSIFFEQVELFTGQQLPYATLMYTWDGEASVGSVLHYPRSSRIRYLVVEQGAARTGQWLGYRRNVAQDYLRVFGEPPGRISHVGVLADSDDLKNSVEAWFGDIAFGA
jgi:hypothetical protein